MVLEERQPQQIDARNHECGDQCDAMPPLPLATAEQAAEEVAGLLRRFTGAKTAIHKLTAETPRFTL